MKKEFKLPEADYKLYILLCRKNTYYVGITSNLQNRMFNHQKGKTYTTSILKPQSVYKVYSLGWMSYEEACIFEDLQTIRMNLAGNKAIGGRFCRQNQKQPNYKKCLDEIPDEYKEITLSEYPFEFTFYYKTKAKKKKEKPIRRKRKKNKKKEVKNKLSQKEKKLLRQKRLASLSKTKAKFKGPSLGHKTGVDGLKGLIKYV